MYAAGLIKTILSSYPLPVDGVHGPAHWARVLENGTHLAEITGADLEVVQLFAVLHDSRRTTEDECYEHGQEAADFAQSLRGTHIHLDDDRFELLYEACARHIHGETEADITVQTCWDADRLDLGRVWIIPRPEKMCTEPGRDQKLIDWATVRAKDEYEPDIVAAWLEGY
jgi:uncharacterized protein